MEKVFEEKVFKDYYNTAIEQIEALMMDQDIRSDPEKMLDFLSLRWSIQMLKHTHQDNPSVTS